MKLGVLGGSFNPFHLGHLSLAEKAYSALNLDRLVFVPAYRSPFKTQGGCAASCEQDVSDNSKDRLDMLAAAIIGDTRFAIDSCEIKRQGVSYTVDTLVDIIDRYLPEGKPVLIIGDDVAADFLKWRESGKILEMADIAVARRINSAAVEYPFPHILIENDVMEVSSKDIRQKIKAFDSSKDWQSLIHPRTRAIIQDRQLYGFKSDKNNQFDDKSPSESDITRVEAAARETLSMDRFVHSRNTALHAYDMCRRLGLDPQAGYLAGIAHDLAKQLDNKQMLKIINNEGIKITAMEMDKPNLLHGKAAAVLLRDRFCIHNKDVLEAVAYHTSGSENMGQLAKVIYIADKTDSTRKIEPALRKMCVKADLDTILFAVLEKTIHKIKAKDLDISEDTLKLLNKIKGK